MRDGIVVVDADGHASDYPHWDSEWPHTVDELMKRDDLNHQRKAKILGGNALTFYGMKA